ncbi:MAG: hypothetical protein WBG38_10675 [Nodosilinea sp.]
MLGRNGLRWYKRSTPVLATGLVLLGLAGCDTLGLSRSREGNGEMSNQYVERGFRGNRLVSRMKPVQLKLQNGWQEAPTGTLHPSADLEAYNPDQEMFLVVLGESRAAVGPGNLEEQATAYLQILKRGFTNIIANQSRTGVDRVNNFPAVQYEVRGEVSQRPVAYLHTTAEMGEEYYQLAVWTPENMYAANKDAMQAIVQEFRDAQP